MLDTTRKKSRSIDMPIPLIANSPLQGPSPTLSASHGAPNGHGAHSTKQGTKDAFGALFREDGLAKKPSQTPIAQKNSVPADRKTPEDESEIEVHADHDAGIETESDVIASDIGDQEDVPTVTDQRTDTKTGAGPRTSKAELS